MARPGWNENNAAYVSPLVERYASPEMAAIFSARRKFGAWRRLWVELASAQRALGLPIRASQVRQMRAKADAIDFAAARRWERRLRHDVMAHIRAYGEQCPAARGIIHLGATSAYVVDNADLVLAREAMDRIETLLANLIDALAKFAARHADRVCVAYTHLQPAQFTTVGKRACLWIQDFLDDLEDLRERRRRLPFLGVKGATGTQASFLKLFDGNEAKVRRLEARVARAFGFERVLPVSGQTFPRKIDARIMATLTGTALSAHKMTNDLRLLQHLGEVLEPAGSEQVGSSAMAYKRNPMLAERAASLARLVVALGQTAPWTAATQWFERTLDDSAARRVAIPEAFLAADGMLRVLIVVARGLQVCPERIARHAAENLATLATEDVLMEGVRRGGDRQGLHELIRRHARAVEAAGGREGDLWQRLRKERAFQWLPEQPTDFVDPRRFAGLAPSQAREFLRRQVAPLLRGARARLGMRVDVEL
jgi:adenylosuccinate lyase